MISSYVYDPKRWASRMTMIHFYMTLQGDKQVEESTPILKRKCRAWSFEKLEEDKSNSSREDEESDKINKTLELFPLHPECRKIN